MVLDRSFVFDIRSLSYVLDVNTSTKTALVELNVFMMHLAYLTLTYVLLSAVVSESPVITTNGTIAGTAGESSSFEHEFVSEKITPIKLVLVDGEITRASRNKNPDLFDDVTGIFGSVAIMTLLEIQLVEAKDHMNLTYTPVNSVRELLWRIQKEI